jgi:hypothetical protein
MAPCKFKPASPPPPPDLTVKQSDLPITCKLDNPPAGVVIDGVQAAAERLSRQSVLPQG